MDADPRHPDQERQILARVYEGRGFTADEAVHFVDRVASGCRASAVTYGGGALIGVQVRGRPAHPRAAALT